MQSYYTVTKKNLFDLLVRFSEKYKVFVPYRNGEGLDLGKFDPIREDSIELGGIRQSQPIKSFLNPPREKILNESKSSKPTIVAGVKACDLASLVLQDFVFLKGDYEDPFYSKKRADTLIISCDCTFAKETCFCLAMDGEPYPTKFYDINLSPAGDSFLMEIGSEKGERLIADYKTFFRDARPCDEEARDALRQKVEAEVRGHITKRGTPVTDLVKGAMKRSYDTLEFWQDSASTCVECGACNLVCPTCHCFLLYDQKDQPGAKRFRTWDACLYKTFARVAGGANPRRHLYERLRNRFDKKFAFFPEVLNYFACTGCGRCIEACPGDIDIREVLKGMVSGKWKKPPHE